MIRAVLDANVFVGGILSGNGAPGQILKAWRDQQFHLVTSEAILAEIGRVLRYPKIVRRHGWTESQLEEFIEDVAGLALVTTPGNLKLSVVTKDPADDRYLECAVEGEAVCIVSGDCHLLDLAAHGEVEIVSPREFIELLDYYASVTSSGSPT